MKPRLSCIIATTPRSGSWMLSDALLSSGVIGAPEEYFRPEISWVYRQEWGIPEDAPFIDHIEKAIGAGTSESGVFGVKMHWYQWAWLTRTLRIQTTVGRRVDDATMVARHLPNPHFVFLKRGDVARQAISHYRAVETGVWNVRVDESVPAQSRLADHQPDYGRIRWHENLLTRQADNWVEFFDSTPSAHVHHVAYEDMVEDLGASVVAILNFLGLPVADGVSSLHSNLRPQADDRTEEWLEEYLRVRDTVALNPRPPNDHLRYVPARPA